MDAALQWFVQAFYRLTHSRQFGMAIGPIPMSEMRCYMEMIPPPEFFALGDTLDILQAMDHEYVSKALEETKMHQQPKPKSRIVRR